MTVAQHNLVSLAAASFHVSAVVDLPQDPDAYAEALALALLAFNADLVLGKPCTPPTFWLDREGQDADPETRGKLMDRPLSLAKFEKLMVLDPPGEGFEIRSNIGRRASVVRGIPPYLLVTARGTFILQRFPASEIPWSNGKPGIAYSGPDGFAPRQIHGATRVQWFAPILRVQPVEGPLAGWRRRRDDALKDVRKRALVIAEDPFPSRALEWADEMYASAAVHHFFTRAVAALDKTEEGDDQELEGLPMLKRIRAFVADVKDRRDMIAGNPIHTTSLTSQAMHLTKLVRWTRLLEEAEWQTDLLARAVRSVRYYVRDGLIAYDAGLQSV